MQSLGRTAFALLAAGLSLSACGGVGTPAPSRESAASSVSPSVTPGAATGTPPLGTPAGDGERPGVSVPNADSSPGAVQPWFLTVGDSVTYGYTADPSRAGVNSGWPVQLRTLLANSGRTWQLVDTACPGETLASYRSGCRQAAAAGLGPLAQHDVALAAVRASHTTLHAIFIDLGSNDLLEAYRSGAAASDPGKVIGAIGSQLEADVAELQAAAPGVPIVVANFYNPLANSDPLTVTAIAAVNAAVAGAAARHGARLADFASAINTAPTPDQHLCDLIDCRHLDIHPTIAGHAALAAVALRALG